MEKLKVCICDDDKRSLPTYAAAVKGSFQGYGIATDVEMYVSTSTLRTSLKNTSYNVIFLDIDMPGEDGITFAKWLRKQKNDVTIIFVSAREDKMFETFASQPFGFVRKSRFINDLDEIVRLFLEANPKLSADMILFPTHSGGFQINAKQIVYIESRLHSQFVYTYDQHTYELCSRMETLEQLLSEKGFIRAHKGYIVNYRYIKHIENTEILLTTGKSIPLSRAKKKEVKALWLEYGMKNGFVCLNA